MLIYEINLHAENKKGFSKGEHDTTNLCTVKTPTIQYVSSCILELSTIIFFITTRFAECLRLA